MDELNVIHETLLEDEGYRQAYAEEDLVHRIAERVLRIRLARGLSQKDLAQKLDAERPAIARLEAGMSNPSACRLAKIANALDCRPEDFVSRENPAVLGAWRRAEGKGSAVVLTLHGSTSGDGDFLLKHVEEKSADLALAGAA